MNFDISTTQPTAEEYCDLRTICRLSPKTIEAAEIALPRSIFTVTLRENHKLIGMGRLVGDLGTAIQIVDVAVHPDFQKRGLSRVIMENLLQFIESDVPKCAVVSLFADVSFLYEKFGFSTPKSTQGMLLKRD